MIGASVSAIAQPVRAVLFDLDGTLVDSSKDITDAANAALRTMGLGPFTTAEVLPNVGRGAYSLLAHLAGVSQPGDVRVEAAVQAFILHYREMGAVGSRLYPGVSRLLQSLDGKVRMAVVSNKPEALVWTTLDHLRVDRYFDIIVGGDTLPRKKPDPMPLHWTLKRLAVPAEAAVMVGDSVMDMEAGRRAGVWTAGVTWGFGDPTGHPDHVPHAILDTPQAVAVRFPPALP